MSLLDIDTFSVQLEADELICTSSLLMEGVADEGAWCTGMSLVVTPPVKVHTAPIPCHTWGQGTVSAKSSFHEVTSGISSSFGDSELMPRGICGLRCWNSRSWSSKIWSVRVSVMFLIDPFTVPKALVSVTFIEVFAGYDTGLLLCV